DGEEGEQSQHQSAADKPQLLPDDREDVVVRRGREPAVLLSRVPEAQAEDPAAGHSPERMKLLPASARRVIAIEALGVEETGDLAHPPIAGESEDRDGEAGEHEGEDEDPQPHAGEEQRAEHHEEDDHRRAEVLAAHHRADHEHGDRHKRDEDVLPTREQRLLAIKHIAAPQREGELEELRRLHVLTADEDPVPVAVVLDAERGEHQQLHTGGDDQGRPGDPLPERHGEAAEQEHQRHADEGEEPLLQHDVVGALSPVHRRGAGRREHHHKAEHGEQKRRGGDQQELGGDGTEDAP
ncbi:hypothetical protein ABE10_02075, partial [Bacillus toyonensis]|nr:hypothetical protein [Bacillus toyonensis]